MHIMKRKNNTIFTFNQLQTGDDVSNKNAERDSKRDLQQYYTAVLKVKLF